MLEGWMVGSRVETADRQSLLRANSVVQRQGRVGKAIVVSGNQAALSDNNQIASFIESQLKEVDARPYFLP